MSYPQHWIYIYTKCAICKHVLFKYEIIHDFIYIILIKSRPIIVNTHVIIIYIIVVHCIQDRNGILGG